MTTKTKPPSKLKKLLQKKNAIVASCEILNEIYDLIVNKGKINPRASKREWWINNNSEFLYEFIQSNTSGLPDNCSFSERIYALFTGISSRPKCLECGVELKFDQGYSKYCSKHIWSNENLLEKRRKTVIEKYGDLKNFSSEKHRQAVKETIIEKHGVEHPMHLESTIKKIQKTTKDRYGREWYTKTDEYRDKSKQTSLKKYGVEHHTKTKEYKINASCNSVNYKGWREKEEEIKRLYVTKKIPKQEVAEKLGYSLSHFNKILVSLGLETDLLQNKLYPIKKRSLFEMEVEEWLRSYYTGTIEISKRSYIGKELDIVLPDSKIAIECNGLYWHSEISGNKGKTYHLDKTLDCCKIGMHLVHIFDNQWALKQDIVKSRLYSLLNQNTKLNARDGEIKIISNEEKKKFLQETHIQGDVPSSLNYGLYINEELVSVMTFGKPRFSSEYDFELLRFSNKLNTTIRGAASRLYTAFLREINPSSVISYSDRSLNKGGLYSLLGFDFSHFSSPNFYYTKDYKTTESRLKYQKHKLSNILECYDESLSEWQNMKNHGYDRVWDCGNAVYVWRI